MKHKIHYKRVGRVFYSVAGLAQCLRTSSWRIAPSYWNQHLPRNLRIPTFRYYFAFLYSVHIVLEFVSKVRVFGFGCSAATNGDRRDDTGALIDTHTVLIVRCCSIV